MSFVQSFLILIFLTTFVEMETGKLVSIEFEVYGKVQGVFFRKYTQKEAQKLGLRGWCMNTPEGTVKGVLEGPLDNVKEMKNWLQTIGSPQSKITKAEFKSEKIVHGTTKHRENTLTKDFRLAYEPKQR